MAKSTLKFIFQNLSKSQVSMAIEPWADAATLKPDEIATFECDEPIELEIAYLDPQNVTIVVIAKKIIVTTDSYCREFNEPSGGWTISK